MAGEPMESDEWIDVILELKWSEDTLTQKKKSILIKRLQTWFKKREKEIDISVLRLINDEHAVIRIKPPPGSRDLQDLSGQTLTHKSGHPEADVTILSLNQLSPELEEELTSASTTKPPSDPVPPLTVPDYLYMHVHNKHKDELHRILEENGVTMRSEVLVFFEAKQNNGNPTKAQSEYRALFERSLSDFSSESNTDIHHTPNSIKKCEKGMRAAVAAGPTGGHHEFNGSSVTSLEPKSPSASLQDPSMNAEVALKIKMTIRDDPLQDGLSVDENSWKQISSSEQIKQIKSKFEVDFESLAAGDGTHTVKAFYNKGGANASMESHAIRALLRLYQKIATAPLSLARLALTNNPWNTTLEQAAAAAAAPLTAASANGSGTPEMSEDECPICRDTFTSKTTLVCKHSFCEECVQRSVESMGAICPVCRNVFGVVEGDQPEGEMNSSTSAPSLPGYPNCGTITITYHIPMGKQEKKHPEPGKCFHGTYRTAYLPDNKEGNEVLHLLERAFKQKLIFTIGSSRTTGAQNQVTWNDIHHKTSIDGGPERYGYPDPHYLSRVKEELKAKGIV